MFANPVEGEHPDLRRSWYRALLHPHEACLTHITLDKMAAISQTMHFRERKILYFDQEKFTEMCYLGSNWQ